LIVTDVSGQPIFKGKAVKGDLDWLTLQDGIDRLPRNVGK